MAQWGKALATNSDDLSTLLRSHTMDNFQKLSSDLHMYTK